MAARPPRCCKRLLISTWTHSPASYHHAGMDVIESHQKDGYVTSHTQHARCHLAHPLALPTGPYASAQTALVALLHRHDGAKATLELAQA